MLNYSHVFIPVEGRQPSQRSPGKAAPDTVGPVRFVAANTCRGTHAAQFRSLVPLTLVPLAKRPRSNGKSSQPDTTISIRPLELAILALQLAQISPPRRLAHPRLSSGFATEKATSIRGSSLPQTKSKCILRVASSRRDQVGWCATLLGVTDRRVFFSVKPNEPKRGVYITITDPAAHNDPYGTPSSFLKN